MRISKMREQNTTQTDQTGKTFRVSLFDHKADNQPKPAIWIWDDLCREIRSPEVRAEKDGPLFSGASYPEGKTRANDNVEEISILGLDYDHDSTIENDCPVWQDKGITFAAYTTHSSWRITDSNPDAEERFRVAIPLATPVPADKYRALWRWAYRESGGKIDDQRKDESGMFYRPSVADGDALYNFRFHDGHFLDWRELDLSEPEAEAAPDPAPTNKNPTNGHHNGNGRADKYARAALDGEVANVLRSTQPGRNAQLNASAFALGQLIAADVLDRGEVETELERAAIGCGLDQDREGGGIGGVRRTIRSGIEAGLRQPRVIPESKSKPKAEPPKTERKPETADDGEPAEEIDTVFDDEELLADHGNAARFLNTYRSTTRYVYARKKFLCFDGKRWSEDQSIVEDRANRTVKELKAGAEDAIAFKHYLKSQSPDRRNAMLTLARAEISADFDDFDANPEIFNVANGTIHLPTGAFRRHSPKDLCTKVSKVLFDKDAKCTLWLRFLRDIFNDDQAIIDFMKRGVGYSLSGFIIEQKLFLLYGIGANGKSTFLNIIKRLLGEYATHTQMEIFTGRNRGANGHTEDLARLRGARLVTAVETEESRRLSEGLIKQITGGDPVSASYKNEHVFTFTPIFKLWLAVNHKPIIRGTDDGIWRRPMLIPFLVQFDTDPEKVAAGKKQADTKLESKLLAELPGILNWAIEGYREWNEQGLNPPDSVRAATAQYRKESDVLGAFIEEKLVALPAGKRGNPAGEIHKVYCQWCEERVESALNMTRFGTAMTERGYDKRKEGGTVYYFGLGLAVQQDS